MSGGYGDEWSNMLEETKKVADIEDREARIERISSDPKAYYSPPPIRDYPTTEKHYIVCVDDENANISLPEAKEQYNEPHKIGGVLVSDRLDVPLGWIKLPRKGFSIETIKDSYPELYEAYKEKKIEQF